MVTEPFAIVARRGRGKTYAGSVLAEEMLKSGQQIVVLDPMDGWWGLRASTKQRDSGFPVVIFGGDHADIDITPNMGKEVADFLATEDISVILVPDFESGQEMVEFMTALLDRMLKVNREPIHFFVDEAETFAPEKPAKYETRMLGAMSRLVKKGRIRGLGATLITQRTASLNKNVLTQAAGLLVLAIAAPWDRAPVEAWMKANGTPEQMDELREDLASLPIGEGYFWHPEWAIFKRIRVRKRETYDSSATPEVGQKRRTPKRLSPVDIKRVAKQMRLSADRVQQEDPKELRKQIVSLQRQLSSRPKEVETREVEVEIKYPFIPERVKREFHAFDKYVEKTVQEMASNVQFLLDVMNVEEQQLEKNIPTKQRSVSSKKETFPKALPPPKVVEVFGNGEISLRAGERRILGILASRHPMKFTRAQLIALAHLRKSGTSDQYIANLRRAGFLTMNGKEIEITQNGLDFAGVSPEAPQSTEEVLQMWRGSLRKGERSILDLVVSRYPNTITREEIKEELEYAQKSGTFDQYLANLRRNQLIEVDRGTIKAGEALFL